MLAWIGAIAIVALFGLIITKRLSPLVALIVVPVAASLAAGFGLTTGKFIVHGVQTIGPIAGMFVFAILFFLYWKTEARKKSGYLFGLFLVLLFSVRIVVESVKESQGGFESALGLLSTGQWLSIPFIVTGLYFVFTAKQLKE